MYDWKLYYSKYICIKMGIKFKNHSVHVCGWKNEDVVKFGKLRVISADTEKPSGGRVLFEKYRVWKKKEE